jgi:ATP-binding cassette subfamily B protein
MIQDPERPLDCKISDGHIVFDNVSFSYPNGNGTIFKGLNLEIPSGQKVAFVGTSGSGKTTITRLLQRFYDVNEGAVCIDGQDVRSITQDDLRSHISYIPQDIGMFHRTIRENIAYGIELTDEEIVEIAKKACAHEFITKLPQGYDTLVGERGIKLSGGQRQRVAIARGFAHSKSILVLDEATSSLDSESDQKVQLALSNLLEFHQPTTIVISHRVSTIMKVDMVYVFEEGEIIQQGSPMELLQSKGKFQNLWEAQKFVDAM